MFLNIFYPSFRLKKKRKLHLTAMEALRIRVPQLLLLLLLPSSLLLLLQQQPDEFRGDPD
jgi:hypothetical protein